MASKEVKILTHLKDCSKERVPGLSAGTMPPMRIFIGVQPYRQRICYTGPRGLEEYSNSHQTLALSK